MDENLDKYKDIINQPYPRPSTRTRMSMLSRAAQFAPFAALSTHEESINEIVRSTEGKEDMSDDELICLSKRLNYILLRSEAVTVRIVHFVPDKPKSRGRYVTTTGCIRKYDEYGQTLIMAGGENIALRSIKDIKIVKSGLLGK